MFSIVQYHTAMASGSVTLKYAVVFESSVKISQKIESVTATVDCDTWHLKQKHLEYNNTPRKLLKATLKHFISPFLQLL